MTKKGEQNYRTMNGLRRNRRSIGVTGAGIKKEKIKNLKQMKRLLRHGSAQGFASFLAMTNQQRELQTTKNSIL
jgi:hypothetical protein